MLTDLTSTSLPSSHALKGFKAWVKRVLGVYDWLAIEKDIFRVKLTADVVENFSKQKMNRQKLSKTVLLDKTNVKLLIFEKK